MDGGYFLNAGVLHAMAVRAYKGTKSAKTDISSNQPDALIAVILSAAALEAFINQISLFAESGASMCPGSSPVHNLAAIFKEVEDSRVSVHLKYQLTKLVLSGQPFDKGAMPFQDFELLFRIRNAILHLEPERITEKPHKIVDAICSRGLCEKLEPNHAASWLGQIQTRAVARWACNVVSKVVNALRDCSPPDSGKGVNPYLMMNFGMKHFESVD